MNALLRFAFMLVCAFSVQAGDFSIPVVTPKDGHEPAALNQQLLQDLKTITLHKVSFHNTPVKDVYFWLCTQQPCDRQEFRFMFDINTITQPQGQPITPSDAASHVLPHESPPEGHVYSLLECPLTFELTDVSLGEAIDYVTKLAGLRARIEDGNIVISAVIFGIQTR